MLTEYREFVAAFASEAAALEADRLLIEADRRKCAAHPLSVIRDTPWTPPDTAVTEVTVHL